MAIADDQQILGSGLLIKNPSTADKRSFKGKAKESSSPNPLVGNPVVDGATLTVRADGNNPTSQTFPLPQGTSLSGRQFWSGNTTSGFKYTDSRGEQGPVKGVQIKKTGSGVFLIKVKASAKYAPISVVPPNLGTSGCILLEFGGAGDSYSVAFPSGQITNKTDHLFKIKRPPTEGTCVIPLGTTTSSTGPITTTTESTTSTTESTTSSTESTTSTTESTTSTTESTTSSSTSSSTTSSSTTTSTSSTTTSTLGGPTSPPNVGGTGTITFGVSGASAGDLDGQSVTFTCVDTTWTKLYWGSSSALPAAGLDGFLHTMTFTSFSSTVMFWAGTTNWKDPNTGIDHSGVPTKMTATITAGGLSFVSPPTGTPGGIGATVKVVDPAGSCSTFTVKVEFFADIPTDGSGFIPINTVQQGSGTKSSFTGAFYWVPG